MQHTIWIHFKAPFASFRWMQAGAYRATSTIIPPSTAWGLVCNLAGIETKPGHREDLKGLLHARPKMSLAIGQVSEGSVQEVLHQLHHYLVGNAGKHLAERCHGAKSWISPVKQQHLMDFDCILGVRVDDPIVARRIVDGVKGTLKAETYGLPNAGSSNYFFDTIELLPDPLAARWYIPLQRDMTPMPDAVRLSVVVDHQDSSRTRYKMFAPSEKLLVPPESAWTQIDPLPLGKSSSSKGKRKSSRPAPSKRSKKKT